MAEVMYSEARLRKIHHNALREAARRAPKRETKEGFRVTRRIPKEAYMNAVVNHGVSPEDSEYWDDMERRHPEIAVETQSDKVVFSTATGGRPRKRRNRFGVVTYHKSFG